jgi:2-polyprenyl-3-methyl-5-hydroxy-6-metoxy-1,4-benzoquinol methylase
MWFRSFRYFVRPPESVYRDPALDFLDGCHTYGEYNYLRPGLVARVKTAHFERALALTREHFGRADVIDFGCADGVFLPSLARHFPFVAAVERVPHFAEVAERVVEEAGLSNALVVCNEGRDLDWLRERLGGREYRIAFCLEVLEHVGEPGDLYGPKLRLLDELFSLLGPDGCVVLSVPTMVGLPFLIQRTALAATGGFREPLSWRQIFRAGVLRDTSELEPHWDGGHLGFSHLRLEAGLRERFRLEHRESLGFQMLYVVRRRLE